jgi:hypothetical protein
MIKERDMKTIRSISENLAPLTALLLVCTAAPSNVNAVTLGCLRVLNAPLAGAKQPFSLVARMDTSWVDALIAELSFMQTDYENLTTGQTGQFAGMYPISSIVYQYTITGADDGTAVIISFGAAATPFGLGNSDACAVEELLL